MNVLLGDPYLNKERLQWVLRAACEAEEEKSNVFAEVAADMARRTDDINVLLTCLEHLKGDGSVKNVSCEIEMEAKGLQLARRVMQGDTVMQIEKVEPIDTGWGCVILQAARFVEKEVDISFWRRVRFEAGGEAAWLVSADVLAQVCNRDVVAFDRYICLLLATLQVGGERAAEAGQRLRSLCKQSG